MANEVRLPVQDRSCAHSRSNKHTDADEPMILLSDPDSRTTLKASSVLQRNTKLYGPMNALNGDSSNSKSWNSEGNTESETYLLMKFDRPVLPVNLKLQFQAGFSAGSFSVHLYHDTADVAGTKNHIVEFECCDVHELQTFQLEELDFMLPVSRIKFVMNDFADFYGRVILYRIEVWGHPVDGEASIE